MFSESMLTHLSGQAADRDAGFRNSFCGAADHEPIRLLNGWGFRDRNQDTTPLAAEPAGSGGFRSIYRTATVTPGWLIRFPTFTRSGTLSPGVTSREIRAL